MLAAAGAGIFVVGCKTAPSSESGKAQLSSDTERTLATARNQDPSIRDFMNTGYGYAVFPDVGKGGLGVGGAYGRGEVFEQGRMIGYTDLTQATVGLQAGGQEYSEIIVFQNKQALDNFKSGKLKFSGQASAVALKSGAGANAAYTDGVSVFTFNEKGLMAEASIGGQSFSFQPL
jgi:lipid-binding SYLF domain-containing protein